MKKVLVIISILFASALCASAQTTAGVSLSSSRQTAKVEKKASAASRQKETRGPAVIRVGPSTTYLKNGLRPNDVVRFLGRPATVSERRDGELSFATYIFARSGGRILVAEFENGVLVNSYTEAGQTAARNIESGQ